MAEFRYYATSLDESTIHLEVSADDAEFQRVGTVNFADASSEGWVKARFSLDAFKQARNIQIAICPKSPESMANVHIDAITVKEDYEYNLTARTLTAPQRMMVGENAKITFTVENTGRKTAKDFTVELYRDDKLEQTLEGVTTLPDKSRDYIFEVSPRNIWNDVVNWTARVVWSSDLYEADNTTAVKESKITRPNYPAINDLSGELTDSHEVNLSWSEPTVGSAGGERTLDDVESYKAFSIDGFGDWTVRDDDKATTYGISGPSGAMQYENAGMPMSFMAFNPVVLGIPTIDGSGADTGWMPHSDEQVFASFGSTSGKNDDWLISPLLPGIAQEVSFWVKSVTDQYGFEKYEVYYSTTGIEKADFIRIGDMRSAPVQWVEEKVQLPEDTRYFAIRCVSEDAYIFMVDDISFYASASYTGELSLVGYNVYRNDECLTSEPIMEQEYTDTPAEGSKYRYAVTVVYDKGESAYSNVVNINLVGVEDINADGVNVVASKGKVTITGAEGRQIRIFTIDGKTVTSFTATDSDEVYLTPAVYIVQVDDKAVKLQVL